jgi:hypothetical protein
MQGNRSVITANYCAQQITVISNYPPLQGENAILGEKKDLGQQNTRKSLVCDGRDRPYRFKADRVHTPLMVRHAHHERFS